MIVINLIGSHSSKKKSILASSLYYKIKPQDLSIELITENVYSSKKVSRKS